MRGTTLPTRLLCGKGLSIYIRGKGTYYIFENLNINFVGFFPPFGGIITVNQLKTLRKRLSFLCNGCIICNWINGSIFCNGCKGKWVSRGKEELSFLERDLISSVASLPKVDRSCGVWSRSKLY